jgi:predicted Rdx family selenoprotein
MATEFWAPQNAGDVAIRLTPAAQGRLEVYLNGEKIFDRKEDPGGYPNLTKINELKGTIAEKIYDFDASVANN